ncbi:NUDIX hydrolase [Actinomadura madurae]|uniref:NUDIX hydrolase n=1 Tax=Actinomadura madurae TaxID=1993 RepID=UPI0020D234DD|nr:NUDIX domain-containing protein [Actinomadura madurae]MCP9947303.1 NUDIX domain-containing protein [Actinomadura madurae]MCP9964064.1 NUDIX domain-containing protein [Actinomadura madurae]MCP9976539.1 NUDIX domain-containing protein [Actinomadura madurae]MCQ0011963.1 NUDIX domain-containing protein [Actinomadura madurae]MCQ0012735.1 NUDIX domain-containing protein [Actinomadura madurae]
MRWKVHSEKPLYTDEWLDIRLADVEITGGRHLAHRLIRSEPGAGAVVVDDQRRVLLEWRHRFITDAWGYEIPIGGIREGEDPAAAAAREVEEETGWRPGPMRPFTVVHPTPGISDSRHHIFWADGATQVGPPAEDWEAERVEWVPLPDIRGLVEAGEVVSGTSMAALLLAAAML